MIKNIIFDMGNVLFTFNQDYYLDKFGVTDKDDRQLLKREMYFSYDWWRQDRGEITLSQAEAIYKSRIPERLHDAIHHLIFDWNQYLPPVPGMADLVKELKENGYSLYLLSNAAADQHRYWLTIPGHEYFDSTLISCDVNLLKPEHEIYELLLKNNSLNPGECVFIDDNTSNVEAAHHCGIEGIVFFGDVDDLRQRLKKLGVNCR